MSEETFRIVGGGSGADRLPGLRGPGRCSDCSVSPHPEDAGQDRWVHGKTEPVLAKVEPVFDKIGPVIEKIGSDRKSVV